ncbi:MAG: cytochrome c [Prochloron sp. SP5CPC1]|nr:cytochrome c [Candidatus Paraprochloron terpiosi SP5CPC1]
MDNQFVHPKMLVLRIALTAMLVLGIVVLGMWGVHWYQVSDPYMQEVLSLKGDVVQGNAIFQINCAGCHGSTANGKVGPSLVEVSKRKSKVSLIYQVISGKTPPMPKFQPNPQEMADLLQYLEEL